MQNNQMQYDPQARFQLGGITFLAGLFFLNFASRMMLAPILPLLEADMSITHAQAGGLFFFLSAGYCGSLLASGYMASKVGHKLTAGLASICTSVALVIVACSQDLWSLRGGIFTLGIAAGLYLPSGIALVASLSPPAHWGRAMAIHEMAPNLALGCSPLMAELLFMWTDWRGVAVFWAVMCFAMGVLFIWKGKGGSQKGVAPTFGALKKVAATPGVWTAAIIFSLGLGASLGVYSLLTLYLVDVHQFERADANLLLGLPRFSGVVLVFFAGWISDKLGARRTILVSLALLGIFTAGVGLATGWLLIAMVLLQFVASLALFPATFSALSQATRPETRNLAVGISTGAAALVGTGAIPSILGVAGHAGHFQTGYALLGLVLLLGAFFVMRFDPTKQAVPEDN